MRERMDYQRAFGSADPGFERNFMKTLDKLRKQEEEKLMKKKMKISLAFALAACLLLAAVALVLGTVVLVKMQRTKYIWVTVIPAAWLLLCTTWALGLKLFSSNPQMEGFFFMAQQYKEKIAAGGELTAQQIANMNHIVVNNYTNAGLSILFLVVVYSIIFYGIKTWLNVRNNKVRTDKETPYVPVPEGGVKTSSHH